MMIVNVPIEPVKGRYSEDWGEWFLEELEARKYNFKTVIGQPLRTEIKDGSFLDVVATNHYKSQQITKICALVDSGDIPRHDEVVFLIHDGWFPIEQLAYLRDMLGCQYWKFVGIFHAGTYDPWDQTAQKKMYTWGADYENALFKIYDLVVIASSFHYKLMAKSRKIDATDTAIIPWKVAVPSNLIVDWYYKKDWIVFPHRPDPEKQPAKFENLAEYIAIENIEAKTNWTCISTAGKCSTKEEYYKTLQQSKIAVSFALQETFGIAMVEAVLLGCIPLVPDRLAYSEMYPDCFKYRDDADFTEKLIEMMHDGEKFAFSKAMTLRDNFRSQSSNFFDNLFYALENL